MATSGQFNTTGYQGRYLTFAWELESQSFETNTSVISWTLKGAGTAQSTWYKAGNFKVVINGVTVYQSSTRINLYNGTLVASGELTINHASDGTKSFSASAEAGIYLVAVNCSGSGSWTLPTIYRYATITSAPNFTDIESPALDYSNPAGDNVSSLQACISINGSTPTIDYRDISKTATSYIFDLTEAERNTLRAATPNSKTLSVTFLLKTVISGQTYIQSLQRTLTIVNANPTISGVSYRDTNSATTAITDNNQQIIQNNSTLSFTLGSLTALKYATLSSVSITVNSVTKTTSLTGSSISSQVISFGLVNSSSNLLATITLTDSRGYTSTVEVEITMLAWSLPTAIITCARVHNYYSETDLNVNADYSSLDGKNTITIQYQTKEADSSSWSALQTIQDDVTETLTLDNTEAWDIRVIVTDRIGSTTYNLSIDRGIPLVFFDRLKRSLSVNCLPQYENSFEINYVDPFNYHEGDTIELTDYYTSAIALSNTVISFTLKLDKIIGDNDISFTNLALSVISSGSSAEYSNFLNVGSLSITKSSDTSISVTATITGATYPVAADTVIGIKITGIIVFSATSPITWDYELSNREFDGTANTLIFTGINPFSVANINRNWEIILNAETTETAENKTDIGLFYRYSTTATYNLELGIKPTQTYIDRYRNIGGSEQTINVGSSGQDVKITKINDMISIYINGVEVWSASVTLTGSDAQEMTVGGVKMSGTYYFLGHLNYFKFRFTN